MTIRVVLLMAIAAFSATFALQNAVTVTVVFIVWRFESSLALVMLFALLAGALIVAILAAPSTVRARLELASRERRLAELHRKVEELEQATTPGKPQTAAGPVSEPRQKH